MDKFTTFNTHLYEHQKKAGEFIRKYTGDDSSVIVDTNDVYLIIPTLDAGTVAEFVDETIFIEAADERYRRYLLNGETRFTYDPEGKPEAVIHCSYDSFEEHCKRELSRLRKGVRNLDRLEVVQGFEHPDDDAIGMENLQYFYDKFQSTHMCELSARLANKETRTSLFNVAALGMAAGLNTYRLNYFYEGTYVGYAIWNNIGCEHYWSLTVQRRDEQTVNNGIGTLILLDGLRTCYNTGKGIYNLGLNILPYKQEIWKAEQIYRPGLRVKQGDSNE